MQVCERAPGRHVRQEQLGAAPIGQNAHEKEGCAKAEKDGIGGGLRGEGADDCGKQGVSVQATFLMLERRVMRLKSAEMSAPGGLAFCRR